MHRSLHLMFTASVAALLASPAAAQDAPQTSSPDQAETGATETGAPAQTADETGAAPADIVVTARKREEALQDVPVAATAITGDVIEKRGLVSVRDVAALTPSLNINSDGTGRAFVAIRGVGTTLIDSVQPGVGIFIDGIYQPNTSYLNNPLTDVERVEVLRGPQGTLYGKNTLGGAINVITRQPSNRFEGKLLGSYSPSDDAFTAGGSISGPIIADRLQARIAYVHQEHDGFVRNTLIDKDAFPLNTDTVSGTIRATPVDDVRLTVNGYYSKLTGGAVSYAFVDSPTDYEREVQLNATNYQFFKYRGVNAKLELPLDALATEVTLIGAYDNRDVDTPDSDPDFTAVNLLRATGHDDLKTRTGELRFDTELSPTLSSIVGLFISRETRRSEQDATVFPGVFDLVNSSLAERENKTYAVFGNLFWRPVEAWEVSAGLRWDKQKQKLEGLTVDAFPAALGGLPPVVTESEGRLSETNISPRLAVTRHWNKDLMSYASVSKGFRGGGFNPPGVPDSLRTYKGDKVWAYELGTKYTSPDRRMTLAAAAFYNDYRDFIGLNSIFPLGASFTTVDLNTGDVESYGVELEGTFRATSQWTLSGGGSLMRARITDSTIFEETLGRELASDRLPFQPDWNFHLNSDYVVPVGNGDITFNAGLIGKGSRIAATLSETEAPVLKSYVLANAALTYRIGGLEIGAFVNNLFNKDYMESYIEKTTLILAGLPASDVGIAGDKRRYGIRTRVRF